MSYFILGMWDEGQGGKEKEAKGNIRRLQVWLIDRKRTA